MSQSSTLQPADTVSVDAVQIEGEIKELVRKASRDSADKRNETFAPGVSDTIQRVTFRSAAEIDRLINELTQLRTRLQDESKRVQGEIARVQGEIAMYTQTSDAAMQSIKAIDQSLRAVQSHYRPEPE